LRFPSAFVGLREVVKSLLAYPAPVNLNYMWNFGVYSLVSLAIQIVTGLLLACHFVADINIAFLSVEHIMRDIQFGWMLRYVHANGASVFFIVVYVHILRGLFYGSFTSPRELLWSSGVVIFLLMIVTAFLGYVLPWGQMSFWAATVITNLVSAIPFFGQNIVYWLWGGFAIDAPTLTRFYALHFLLPFVIAALVGFHLALLHKVGSNNPLGVKLSSEGGVPLLPYYTTKDLLGIVFFIIFLIIIVFFFPNHLSHPDNYIPANPLVTPAHIVPEWYFLLFYAILRSVLSKLGGVLALLSAILVLFLLPTLMSSLIKSMRFRPYSKYMFQYFVVSTFFLGWLGSQTVSYPFLTLTQFFSLNYFFCFIVLFPLVIDIEEFLLQSQEERFMTWEVKPPWIRMYPLIAIPCLRHGIEW
jgi:ubiquinol-cytochrome c reductase cytochrome b/c1 subunit